MESKEDSATAGTSDSSDGSSTDGDPDVTAGLDTSIVSQNDVIDANDAGAPRAAPKAARTWSAQIVGGTAVLRGPGTTQAVASLSSLAQAAASRCIGLEGAAPVMAIAEQLGASQLAAACGEYIAQNADFVLLSSTSLAQKARAALAEDGSSLLGGRWTSEEERESFKTQRRLKHAEIRRRYKAMVMQEQALASTPEGQAAMLAKLHPDWEGGEDGQWAWGRSGGGGVRAEGIGATIGTGPSGFAEDEDDLGVSSGDEAAGSGSASASAAPRFDPLARPPDPLRATQQDEMAARVPTRTVDGTRPVMPPALGRVSQFLVGLESSAPAAVRAVVARALHLDRSATEELSLYQQDHAEALARSLEEANGGAAAAGTSTRSQALG